ncbi:MAG: dicarboxylate/amino acid:cation symporter [Spirochaetaceae bacterium]|nr:dicarboxylate/amino acid:cation symporter [Spirochaetaceae bacterium]GMO17908.1 MAG: dicarboxylate/amino acid:cation symporter [Termitinemataceae bacterium]
MSKKIKIGLTFRLLIAIALGIIIGKWMPAPFCRIFITAGGIVSSFLSFVIPLVILAFVTLGIANLSTGAGLLLVITAGLSYFSSLVSGTAAFITAENLFPSFISDSFVSGLDAESGMLAPFFKVPIPPVISVIGAVALAFILGLCISAQRARNSDNTLYKVVNEFSEAISGVLRVAVIPLLPLLICGTFVNMTVSGQTFSILNMLWKVFLTVIILHFIYMFVLFCIAAAVGKRNPFKMMRNQISGYMTAIGTQSSAATIPVNLKCAEANGVSNEIRNFTIPLCANIHMAGSMITITSCVTAVLLMNNMPVGLHIIVPFILTLGVAMIASPGAPGGSIMTALPFLPIVGIPQDGAIASLLIALYITQDSFGTACNVSGDNALSVIVDTIYSKYIKK